MTKLTPGPASNNMLPWLPFESTTKPHTLPFKTTKQEGSKFLMVRSYCKVRAPMAVGQYGTNPGPCAGNWPTTVNIMDTVRVPADLAPGEYVLGWRWDCELTAQVWSACADITIAPADPVVEA